MEITPLLAAVFLLCLGALPLLYPAAPPFVFADGIYTSPAVALLREIKWLSALLGAIFVEITPLLASQVLFRFQRPSAPVSIPVLSERSHFIQPVYPVPSSITLYFSARIAAAFLLLFPLRQYSAIVVPIGMVA